MINIKILIVFPLRFIKARYFASHLFLNFTISPLNLFRVKDQILSSENNNNKITQTSHGCI